MNTSRCLLLLFCSVLICGPGWAQDAEEYHDDSGKPPPNHYESWSLFLVCNHDVLLPENEAQTQALHRQFRAFGEAIGPRHVAIWFRKSQDDNLPDVDRSLEFCLDFDLLPSKSPYVVFLTTNPYDIAPGERVKRTVFTLGGLNDPETTAVLRELTDELFRFEMERRNPKRWWFRRKLVKALKNVRKTLVELAPNISVTVQGGPVAIEVDHSDG